MRDRRKQRAMRRAKAHRDALIFPNENRNRDPTFYEAMSNISRDHSIRINRQVK